VNKDALVIDLSDMDKTKIKERFSKLEWKRLRSQAVDKGWGIGLTGKTGSNQGKYLVLLAAVVLDPTLFLHKSEGVYSTT